MTEQPEGLQASVVERFTRIASDPSQGKKFPEVVRFWSVPTGTTEIGSHLSSAISVCSSFDRSSKIIDLVASRSSK